MKIRCKLIVIMALMIILTGSVLIETSNAFTAADADTALAKFNAAFYTGSAPNNYFKNDTDGGGPDFWKGAEMIELIEDAYDRSGNSNYRAQLDNLYKGFCHYFGTNWTGNIYNDDLMWMVLVCERAYQITGNKDYLNQAKYHFDQVYARGYDTVLGGGIWWTTAKGEKNSCINGPAIIAACKLYQLLNDNSYLTKARNLYTWQTSKLWDSTTGAVYDNIKSDNTVNKGTTTYNQGTFIGASHLLYQITGTKAYYNNAIKTLDYTKNNMTTGGILRSEAGIPDTGGFKGIFCRYALKFTKDNNLTSYNSWFQLNANTAWSHRDARGLMDQNWSVQTGSGRLYSWWCSAAVVLLQVCPPDQTTPGVICYQDVNYGGTASQMLTKGSYTLAQLNAKGIPNDWMSALKVPSGWTVTVYENDNFTGTSWTFTADTSWVGAACNDKMSSCRIQ